MNGGPAASGRQARVATTRNAASANGPAAQLSGFALSSPADIVVNPGESTRSASAAASVARQALHNVAGSRGLRDEQAVSPHRGGVGRV